MILMKEGKFSKKLCHFLLSIKVIGLFCYVNSQYFPELPLLKIVKFDYIVSETERNFKEIISTIHSTVNSNGLIFNSFVDYILPGIFVIILIKTKTVCSP